MASTYTTNNGIEKIGSGEQAGTWDDTTNTNFDLIDESLDGQVTITLAATGSSGAPNALTITDGASSNGRNRYIEFNDGGDLGGTAYVQLAPNDAEKIFFVKNSLSGSRSILLFQGTYNASNDYELVAGTTVVVKFDGAGAGATCTEIAIVPSGLTDASNVTITGGSVTGTTITLNDANGAAPTADGEIKFDRTGENLEVGDGSGTKSFSHDTGAATLQNKTIDSANNTLTLDLGEGTLTGTTAEFNTALSDGSFTTLAGSETLTNKTLTGPTITSPSVTGTVSGGAIYTSPVLTTPQINDASSDHQYIFAVSELLADRTVTLPLLTGNDTFAFNDFAATLQNKTIDSAVNTLTLDLGEGTLTGTTAEFNTALQDGSFATLAGSETLSSKSLTAPTLTGTVLLSDELAHTGDTDNKIVYGTDTQDFQTGASSRLDINNSGIRLGGANARVTTVLDEDAMGSDSATALATQQSIKAYVDANGGGWTLVQTQEPTSEVDSITTTGLSSYTHVRGYALFETNGTAAVTLQARASAGTWRTIQTVTPAGADDASYIGFNISDFNSASRPKFFLGEANEFDATGLTRGDNATAAGGAEAAMVNAEEIWDEIRIKTSDNFKGTTASERAIMTVWGAV